MVLFVISSYVQNVVYLFLIHIICDLPIVNENVTLTNDIFQFMSIRGGDGKYTLLHFLIDQLTASDPQLLNWTDSVSAVRSCQNCSVKALSAEIEG